MCTKQQIQMYVWSGRPPNSTIFAAPSFVQQVTSCCCSHSAQYNNKTDLTISSRFSAIWMAVTGKEQGHMMENLPCYWHSGQWAVIPRKEQPLEDQPLIVTETVRLVFKAALKYSWTSMHLIGRSESTNVLEDGALNCGPKPVSIAMKLGSPNGSNNTDQLAVDAISKERFLDCTV